MRLATAFVEIRPDTTRFRQELKADVDKDAKDISRQLGQALTGGLFLAGAAKATQAASQLEQAVGGTAAVFGQAAKEVEAFSKQAAESAGLSERAARELTSSLGGLLKGFGFTADEAAGLSVKLTTLGADLGATYGTSTEDAIQAIGAALRGETDPLERYGIALNQATVNAKAVELGLAATTSKVDQHGKAQATLALVYERSTASVGQFIRESDTAAGQAKIAAGKTEDAAASLGANLTPIYKKISEVVGAVADRFASLPPVVQTGVIAIAGIAALTGPIISAGSAIKSLAGIARTQLTRGLDGAARGAYNLSGNMGKATIAAGFLGVAAYAVTRALSEQAAEAQAARDRIDGFKDAITEAGDAAGGAAARIAVLADDAPELASVLDAAGVTATDLGAALVGPGDAFDAMAGKLVAAGDAAGLTDRQLALLPRTLNELRGEATTAKKQAEELATATAGTGDTAAGAATGVDTLTGSLEEQDQAAKDAADSVDLFREAVEKALAPLDLEGALDQRAQALADIADGIEERARAVDEARARLAELRAAPVEERDPQAILDAERELQEAIDLTSLALDGNSEAARRNREDLRSLIEESVGVIEAHRDEGASLEELQLIRIAESESLRKQLEARGFARAEIDRYIGRIDAIPLTKATTITADTTQAEAAILRVLGGVAALRALELIVSADTGNILDAAEARGYAAGGYPLDGDFTVGEHGPELLRKRGADLEVVAGATPTPASGGQVNHIAVYVTGVTGESPAAAIARAGRRIAEAVSSRA